MTLERSLQRLGLVINHSDDSALALQTALDCALEIAEVGSGALSVADLAQQRYVLAASRGLSEDYKRGIETWSLHEGLAGQSYGLREPLAIADLQSHPDVAREIVRKEGLRGYACIPLIRGQRRLGILEVFASEVRHFDSEMLRPLEIIGATASAVLESVSLKRDLQKLREERYRVIHDWTAQAAETSNAERLELVDALRTEASSFRAQAAAERLKDSATTGSPVNLSSHDEIAAQLDGLAERTAAAGSPGVDVLPAVRHQLVPRLSEATAKEIAIIVDNWPARLPLELTTRLYQVIHALLAPAAAAAYSAVQVVFDQRGSNLTIGIHDDREALPALDRLSMVTTDARLAVRGLGGFVERTTDPGWTCSVRAVLPFSTSDSRLRTLTVREFEILGALSLGQPNRELATALQISTKTLQNHLTAIYRKLGVSNRTQAMRLAVGHNPTVFWEGSHASDPV
ncbi:hypothetical protein BLJ79_18125 [Arthrobacter sp. UCD-GKA]|uniref:LuxR C-terminal-related transcriptional regulator n=1 Tax=Arthrobacter sp. UCD-GKA TaxID=1913576 RepID=UPI0008DD91EA|nr:GAF domain-containing protein [Arthrobacter sp. UCD-GKA]OIH82861.1 hypothetical protein BLJ79_18125 [Arthrobacter sp. UCD-GKA]